MATNDFHNIHRMNLQNCGDMSCSPMDYFDLQGTRSCISYLDNLQTDKKLILGGGGLFFSGWIESLERFSQRKNTKIIWGAGLNLHYQFDKARYPKFIQNFDLIGVRDYGHNLRWVPCASCLHPLFDNEYEIQHEAVIFEHKEVPIISNEFPKMNNATDMTTAIKFLASGEHIITNSYHGAYWGTLLSRKVVVIPLEGSSRFFFFKHPPKVIPDYSADFSKTRSYDCLYECREANKKFYEDVISLCNKRNAKLCMML
jgi:hypothetical protein